VTLVAARYELRTLPESADRLRGLLLRDRQPGMLLVDTPPPATPTTADELLARH
jgi:hypothetical protein